MLIYLLVSFIHVDAVSVDVPATIFKIADIFAGPRQQRENSRLA
jgi:hypothetical protein